MKTRSRKTGPRPLSRPRKTAPRQYTVRGVPADVDIALREKARTRGQSLNDVVLDALRRASGLEGEKKVYHDLDHLFGSMPFDPEFDRAIEDQRQIDWELWR